MSVFQGAQMLLDIKKLKSEDERVERRYEIAAFTDHETDYAIAAPVDLAFDVHERDDEYRLEGRVSTTLELTCSRCLEGYQLPVSTGFDRRYLPQKAEAGERASEVGPDDLTIAYYCDDTIDLGHLMREQFYLVMPMKPLCKAECRGLCARCGTNLNASTCSCDTAWRDPRLEGLEALVQNRRSE